MSGSDQSARLQGLLSGIAGTVGELGAGGDWTSNAIRTVNRPDFMAGSFGNPEFDMNNVDNLDAMANWASRNGYEDQAKQYMTLASGKREVQGKKQYADQLATNTEKLRGLYSQLGAVKGNPDADPSALAGIQNQITLVENAMNENGAANMYGVANAGSEAGRSAVSSMAAMEKAALESRKLAAQTVEAEANTDILISKGDTLPKSALPGIDYDAYQRAMSQTQGVGDRVRKNNEWTARSKGWQTANKELNATVAGSQIAILFNDVLDAGKSLFNDDGLTDFLQELAPEDKQVMNEVIVAYALRDPKWVDGDTETQQKIIQDIFVEQYSQLYREGFGGSLAKRLAGEELEESDALANYKPNTNPDISSSDGGGKEMFEQWYADEKSINPSYTIDQAREDWDQQYKLTTEKNPYRSVPLEAVDIIPGREAIVDAYEGRWEGSEMRSNYEDFLKRKESRQNR